MFFFFFLQTNGKDSVGDDLIARLNIVCIKLKWGGVDKGGRGIEG